MTSDTIFNDVRNRMGVGELWIGMFNNPRQTGIWRWSDGSPFTFDKWLKDEPSDDPLEYCVEMQKQTNAKRITGWNNANCADKKGWVCSRKTCGE